MAIQWSLTTEIEKAHLTQVFSGGACNILDEQGRLLRNTERDPINDWLTSQKVIFFDPQIHPDSHGVEYDYVVHHPLEVAARKAATINLYEVSPHTFGGITSLEIASDHFRWQEPTVIYYSDGDPDKDEIPAHSRKGHPLFTPRGIYSNDEAMRAHYREFIKNANNMRKYLMRFAREMDSLTVTFGDRAYEGDIIISPDRMHAVDMFKAVVNASSGKRVIVNFTGGEKAQDERGNPVVTLSENPPEVQMRAMLDQYIDEGNALRRAIAELIEISVYVRVVYTQKSVMQALQEVLKIKGLI